jgi:hypothetical protein
MPPDEVAPEALKHSGILANAAIDAHMKDALGRSG